MNLRNRTIAGVAWSGAGNAASQILGMITLVVMVRLLTPEDYGTYAVLMIFVGFLQVLGRTGTVQAVIYLDNPSERMLSSIFMLNLSVGMLLYFALYLLANPIAGFFNNEAVVNLLRVIGVLFVIASFNLVQEALLQKHLAFRAIVVRDLVSQVVAAGVGIGMALLGYGVASLVGAALAREVARTALLWRAASWRPKLRFSFTDIRHIWSYCFNLTGFSFVNYFARNADNFLIGKFLGAAALGVYSVAYNLMMYPLTNVAQTIVRVLFPVLSSVKADRPRFKRFYLKIISVIALLTFPIMFGLLAVADSFVVVVFGNRWADLAPLLQILSLVGMMQSIVTTAGVIYTALGTTDLMLKIGAVNAGATVLSFVVGLPFGVIGVAASYATANLIMLYPNLHYAWSQAALTVAEGLRALRWFFVSALVMAVGVYALGQVLAEAGWTELPVLLSQVSAGAVLYIVVLLAATKLQVVNMVRELFPRKQSALV